MGKKNKVGLIMAAAAFVIMVIYLIFIDGADNLANSIKQIQPPFLLLSVVFMLLYWLLEAGTVHIPIKLLYKKQSFKNTFLITVIGQYFNCVTPCASGGQPFQLYYLTKTGTPLSTAMTALLARFIVYQFALTVLSAVLLALRFAYFVNELNALMVLTIVGFIVNFAVIVALIMLAFFRRMTIKLAHGSVWLLSKLHIVRDLGKTLKYIDNEIEQYTENFIFIKSQPLLIIKMSVLSALQLLVYFSISFVLYLGFGLSHADYLTVISCQAFVLMISSFVPIPGALGAAEGSYAAFFAGIFGSFTALSTFIWRLLTFYLPIAAGLITTIFFGRNSIKSDVSQNE